MRRTKPSSNWSAASETTNVST
uniref:Uncharacterized protein n=1 Tax=Anguilla anguilla TaxID=7936 RepID=A0A0E9RCS6_ANGAN